MLFYPQLTSGAICQYPYQATLRRRTIATETIAGNRVSLAGDSATRTWQLRYTGLTEREREALEELFHAAEGRLQSFVFTDPRSNLFRWSGDLGAGVWRHDSVLDTALVSGGNDTRVHTITNEGQSPQTLWQSLPAPRQFTYCLSVRVRSHSECLVRLFFDSTESVKDAVVRCGSDWVRATVTGSLSSSGIGLRAGIELPAGAQLDVREFQFEAQPSPSPYIETTSSSGLTEKCRFVDDRISFECTAPQAYSTTVTLQAPEV